MTSVYSTLTKQKALREIRVMRKEALKITSTPEKARQFLISAGIADKSGKHLAPQYR
jgi:hypothetical protein